MLGTVKARQSWAWGAAGKHPVARDYIAVGASTPLLKAFSDWVEAGFSLLDKKPELACSWRLWARGMNRQELVCGLLKSSHDSVGRPFPFLVLGTGPLEGWEEAWDLLPYVFEGLWSRMEYLCSKKAFDLAALENDVAMLPYPTLFQGAGTAPAQGGKVPGLAGLACSDEVFLPLGGSVGADPSETLAMMHAQVKSCMKEAPNVVFMGGVPDRPQLAAYRRSLAARDFVRLWTGEVK